MNITEIQNLIYATCRKIFSKLHECEVSIGKSVITIFQKYRS